MRFEKASYEIRTNGSKKGHEQVEGYEFEAEVKGEALRFGVHKDEHGNWGVTDLRTGCMLGASKESTRKQAVEGFGKYDLPRFAELYGTERYSEMCDEFLDILYPPQSTKEPKDESDEVTSKVDALIAKHEVVGVAGETSCAVYLNGIEKGSEAMAAAKELGARFGNHKRYGKCWYFKKG